MAYSVDGSLRVMRTSAACLHRLMRLPPGLPASTSLMLKEIFIVSHISYSLCSPALTTLSRLCEKVCVHRWMCAISVWVRQRKVGLDVLLRSWMCVQPTAAHQSSPPPNWSPSCSGCGHPWVSKCSLISWNLFEASEWDVGNEVVLSPSLHLLVSDKWIERRVG